MKPGLPAIRRNCMAGVTLIELIAFIVIVSVGLAGVMSAFNVTLARSADPMIQKQLLAIAESTLEEVLLKDFGNAAACTAATVPSCRPSTPADRQNYNSVDHYAGYTQTGITEIDGTTAVAGLGGYTLAIAVTPGATLGTGGAALAGADVKMVTVTVTSGGESVALTGFRTNI